MTGKFHVLVVDDDPDKGKLLEFALGRALGPCSTIESISILVKNPHSQTI
jgi:hypothetical protein